MATERPVSIAVTLRPVGCPWVKISMAKHTQQLQLDRTQTFSFDFVTSESVVLNVEHFNKADADPTTAVEITEISFFGISDPRFVWAGVYRPNYPMTWFEQQADKPQDILHGQSYLGWNGTYSLDFGVPVFEWMHGVLNLGWIYR